MCITIIGTVLKCMMTIRADNVFLNYKLYLTVKTKENHSDLSVFLTKFNPSYI